MLRNEEAFWYYNNNTVNLYEEGSHCYFLLFHFDEVGIPKDVILAHVKAYGFDSIKDAQEHYFDPWNINEYDDFWRGLVNIAYSRGVVRGGFYYDGYSYQIYISCDDIKKRKGTILDILMSNPKFKKGTSFTIENSNSELARRHRGDGLNCECITAHSLDEAILSVDSY